MFKPTNPSYNSYSIVNFPIAVPFLALCILTILRDKCQMKSFKDINILTKAKRFLENIFLEKAFIWKKMFLKKKFKKLFCFF